MNGRYMTNLWNFKLVPIDNTNLSSMSEMCPVSDPLRVPGVVGSRPPGVVGSRPPLVPDAENAAAVMLGASGRWVSAAARMGGAPRWARVMAGEEGGVAGSRPSTV